MGNRLNGFNNDGLKLSRAELREEDDKKRFVWRLKGSEMGTLTCFSPVFWGVNAHWDNAARRTQPHFTDAERCPGCQNELPMKQLYYLFCNHIEKNRLVFLELTEGAAKAIKRQMGTGETLRGAGLFVQRTKADNGRLQVRLMNYADKEVRLKADEDPHDTLMSLWRLQTGDRRGGREFPTHRNGHLNGKRPE